MGDKKTFHVQRNKNKDTKWNKTFKKNYRSNNDRKLFSHDLNELSKENDSVYSARKTGIKNHNFRLEPKVKEIKSFQSPMKKWKSTKIDLKTKGDRVKNSYRDQINNDDHEWKQNDLVRNRDNLINRYHMRKVVQK